MRVNAWNTQIWHERRLHWRDGALVEAWNFVTAWKPPPVPALNFLDPSDHTRTVLSYDAVAMW